MGHPEVKWSIVSSCLHNRHLLSVSFFKILLLLLLYTNCGVGRMMTYRGGGIVKLTTTNRISRITTVFYTFTRLDVLMISEPCMCLIMVFTDTVLSLGLCPFCNRYINTKTQRFGSRLCVHLQARRTYRVSVCV
jgi:hypothetical protein